MNDQLYKGVAAIFWKGLVGVVVTFFFASDNISLVFKKHGCNVVTAKLYSLCPPYLQ